MGSKINLFDNMEDYEYHNWDKEWQNMPEFKHKDLTPYQSIIVHFKTKEDKKEFSKLVKQNITIKTQSIWFPKAEIKKYINKRYINES
jgi:hypothetical protein